MIRDKIFLSLVVIAGVLAMLLTVGIVYAVEASDNVKIVDNPMHTPGRADFNVAFLKNAKSSGDGETKIKVVDDTTVAIGITGLKKVGDSATAILTIRNNSRDIEAKLNTSITNTNTEYFKATLKLSNNIIKAKKGTVTAELTVELIKLPVLNDVQATIEANIVANPIVKK